MAAAIPALASAYGGYQILDHIKGMAKFGGGVGSLADAFLTADRPLNFACGVAALCLLALAIQAFRGRIQSVVPDIVYAATALVLPLVSTFALGLVHRIVFGVVLQPAAPGEGSASIGRTSFQLAFYLISTVAVGLGTAVLTLLMPLFLSNTRRLSSPRSQRSLAWLWISGALLFSALTVTLFMLSQWLYQRAITGAM